MADFGDEMGEAMLRTTGRSIESIVRELVRTAAYRRRSSSTVRKRASVADRTERGMVPRVRGDITERIDLSEATQETIRAANKPATLDFKVNSKDPQADIIKGPLDRARIPYSVIYDNGLARFTTAAMHAPNLANLAEHYFRTGKLTPNRFPNLDEYEREHLELNESGNWKWRAPSGEDYKMTTATFGEVVVVDEKAQMALCDVLAKEGIDNRAYIDADGNCRVVFNEGDLASRFPSEEAYEAWLAKGGLDRVEAAEEAAKLTEQARIHAESEGRACARESESRAHAPQAQTVSPKTEAMRLEEQSHKIAKAKSAPNLKPTKGAR